MAKTYNDVADWQEIDPQTLPQAMQDAYDSYKAAYRLMKSEREAFEGAMQAGVPEGKRMVFGYRFGKLSVAIVQASEAPAKATAKPKLSLTQFLAAQQSSGARQ